MTAGHYKDSLEAAQTEMEELLTEQSKIEQRLEFISARLNVLRKTVLSIGELLGEESEPQSVGITAAIRKVLMDRRRENNSYISPLSVRTLLQKDDFPLSDYKNALAVIHTTLKRLEDQGELEVLSKSGKTYYRAKESMITDEDIPF